MEKLILEGESEIFIDIRDYGARETRFREEREREEQRGLELSV